MHLTYFERHERKSSFINLSKIDTFKYNNFEVMCIHTRTKSLPTITVFSVITTSMIEYFDNAV